MKNKEVVFIIIVLILILGLFGLYFFNLYVWNTYKGVEDGFDAVCGFVGTIYFIACSIAIGYIMDKE